MARWWMVALAGALVAAGGVREAGADADPNTRSQRAREAVNVAAPADRIWAMVGNFQDMSWLPLVEKTEGKGGNAPGATRRLTLKGGATVDEELTLYDAEHMTYVYRITSVDPKVLPVTGYESWLSVMPGKGSQIVEWRGAFEPAGTDGPTAVKAVSGVYAAGLGNVREKLGKGG